MQYTKPYASNLTFIIISLSGLAANEGTNKIMDTL